MLLYDLHTHTDCSHDGHASMETLCARALELGLGGFAVTDHADCPYLDVPGAIERIRCSARLATAARAQFAGQMEVFVGVEIGEACWAEEAAARIHAVTDYDMIICSVHGWRKNNCVVYYSGEPFDPAHYTVSQLYDFLERYLEDLLEHAAGADYDVLAHLDCPLRYINGKYGRGVDIMRFRDKIDRILRTVISRDKTLELNTSGLGTEWGRTMPGESILRHYHDLGGRRVCVGSDAHCTANLGVGLEEGTALLERMGFAGITVYHNRTPKLLPF